MTMLLLDIQYKAPNIKIKFNMKELSQLENIDSQLFIKTFNSEFKDKFEGLISYHLGLNRRNTTLKAEPFVHIYSEDAKFLAYTNEVCRKINSSSKILYETITTQNIGSSETELKEFFYDYFAQKIIEHNKQQGLRLFQLSKTKNSLSINLDLRKYELSTLDNFQHILKTEVKNQINIFQESYYPNDKITIENPSGLKVISSNEQSLLDLENIFKKLNKYSVYFYEQITQRKYDFFQELPGFLKQAIEVEILNEKLEHKTTTTKKFKL